MDAGWFSLWAAVHGCLLHLSVAALLVLCVELYSLYTQLKGRCYACLHAHALWQLTPDQQGGHFAIACDSQPGHGMKTGSLVTRLP